MVTTEIIAPSELHSKRKLHKEWQYCPAEGRRSIGCSDGGGGGSGGMDGVLLMVITVLGNYWEQKLCYIIIVAVVEKLLLLMMCQCVFALSI